MACWCIAAVFVCVCKEGKCSGRVCLYLCKCDGVPLISEFIFKIKLGMLRAG